MTSKKQVLPRSTVASSKLPLVGTAKPPLASKPPLAVVSSKPPLAVASKPPLALVSKAPVVVARKPPLATQRVVLEKQPLVNERAIVNTLPPQKSSTPRLSASTSTSNSFENALPQKPTGEALMQTVLPLPALGIDDNRKTLVITPPERDTALKNMEEFLNNNPIEEQKPTDGSPFVQLLMVMPHLEYKPKERIVRAPKRGKCHYISAIGRNSWTDRTISWCMLRPGDATCEEKLKFCFNVDELQQFIVDNQEISELKKSERICPMFMRDTLIKILEKEKIEGVIIPKLMSEEFMGVIANFAFIDVGNKPVQEIDRLQKLVVDGLTNFVETKLSATGNPYSKYNPVGAFYHYTKEAMKKLTLKGAKLVIWLLQNPWYLMVANAVAKTVRLMICCYLSLDEIGVEAALAVFDKVIEEVLGSFGGWTRAFVRVLRYGVQCAARGASFQFGSLTICLANIGYEAALQAKAMAQDFLTPFFDTFDYTFGFVMSKLDTIYISDTIRIARTDPINVYIALTSENKVEARTAATTATIRDVVGRFSKIGDWEVMFILFILSKFPFYDQLWQLLCFACPVLIPCFNLYKKYNPLYILAKIVQYIHMADAVWEALLEIKMWIFDLGRCIFNILVKQVMHLFGRGNLEIEGPMAITCCMTDLALLLQKAHADDSVWVARGKIDEAKTAIAKKLEDTKAAFAKKLEDSKETTDRIYKVGAGLSEVGSGLGNFVGGTMVGIGSASLELLAATAHVAGGASSMLGWAGKQMAGWTETMEATNEELFTNLWVLGNTTQKNQAGSIPVMTLDASNHKVPFYFFVTQYDSFYPQVPRVFIMIPIDFIRKNYPRAVFTYFKHDFVLLKHLPHNISKHLLTCKAPVFDASIMFQS